MSKTFQVLFVTLFFFSCKSPKSGNEKNPPQSDTLNPVTTLTKKDSLSLADPEGNLVMIPHFEVEVSLSPKAIQRLGNKETLMVDVFFTGNPIDPSKVELEEDGSYYVGEAKKEISYGEIAKFDNIKIPKKKYDQLADKDFDFNINIYTGRKTSPDNLIDVEFLDGKVSSLQNRHIKLNGKLIGE